MRGKEFFVVALIMGVVVLSAGSLNMLTPAFSESLNMLVMRDIGHRLLTGSGDSTSRVMPVRKLDDQTFLIEFENNFAFVPDSVVAIVHRQLLQTEFPAQYAVHVMRCFDRSIVYAYEMNAGNDIVPCLGRTQPEDCYAVQITFAKTFSPYHQTLTGSIMLAGFAVISFVIFWNRKKKPEATAATGNFLAIGRYKFYPETGLLEHALASVQLSRKETTLLKLFAENTNQLLPRDRLLKEVWEDEGVITGRSLDMFVSKLRKKLHHDTAVTIVSVHGKGYRLEVYLQK